MHILPYLNFDGCCAKAFRFYEKTLGGQITTLMTHGESPIAHEIPPEHHDLVLHATLVIGDALLMASDAPPGRYVPPRGLYVSLQVDDPADADRIFAALAEGGEVQMPIGETFWARRFGMLVDRYGIPWMVNCGNSH